MTPATLLSMVLCVFLAGGCQSVRPDQSQAITQLSTELEEANQKIEEIYHRVSVVQFMVDNHERTIADLEKNLRKSGFIRESSLSAADYPSRDSQASLDKTDKKKDRILLSPDTPVEKQGSIEEENLGESQKQTSAESLYNQGFAALKSKDYTRAISLFKSVVSQYPDHNLADNAVYWTGEIHYTQNDFTEAIRTFTRLIETYPDGGKVPDALLKIGYSYHSLNDKENAVKYLKKVVVDYPFTVPGNKAEAMLTRIE